MSSTSVCTCRCRQLHNEHIDGHSFPFPPFQTIVLGGGGGDFRRRRRRRREVILLSSNFRRLDDKPNEFSFLFLNLIYFNYLFSLRKHYLDTKKERRQTLSLIVFFFLSFFLFLFFRSLFLSLSSRQVDKLRCSRI